MRQYSEIFFKHPLSHICRVLCKVKEEQHNKMSKCVNLRWLPDTFFLHHFDQSQWFGFFCLLIAQNLKSTWDVVVQMLVWWNAVLGTYSRERSDEMRGKAPSAQSASPAHRDASLGSLGISQPLSGGRGCGLSPPSHQSCGFPAAALQGRKKASATLLNVDGCFNAQWCCRIRCKAT